MKSILPTIAKIVIRAIVKGLESDVTRYDEKAKVAKRGEAKKLNKVIAKHAAKRAALRAKLETEHTKERAEKAKVLSQASEAQAKLDAAKDELAKFKKFNI